MNGDGEALPAVEGLISDTNYIAWVHVLSKHLKSWAHSTNLEALNFTEERTAFALLKEILWILLLKILVKLIITEDPIFMDFCMNFANRVIIICHFHYTLVNIKILVFQVRDFLIEAALVLEINLSNILFFLFNDCLMINLFEVLIFLLNNFLGDQ